MIFASSPQTAKLPGASISTRNVIFGLAALLVLCANVWGYESQPGGQDAAGYRALMEGKVDAATSQLQAVLATNPADSYAHQLLCRAFYAQDEADAAIHECQLAAASSTASRLEASDSQMWLGRAYGMKARKAGPISGFQLARKVQASFIKATQLNPANVAALSDLGEYDVDAPFIVGGGTDKAQALVNVMLPRFPQAAHRLLGRMAAANNDLQTAEAEFKRAIAVQNAPEAWVDLAQFYQQNKRPDDVVNAIRSAMAADRTHGPVFVDAASILVATHRAPDLAVQCLREYLSSPAKSDAAPAFKAHLQLSNLLTAQGNTVEAAREFEAAGTLASNYTRKYHSARGGA